MEFSFELTERDSPGWDSSIYASLAAVLRVRGDQFAYEMAVDDVTVEPLQHWRQFIDGERRHLDVNACFKCTVSFTQTDNEDERSVSCFVMTGGDGSDGSAKMLLPAERFMQFARAVVNHDVWNKKSEE